MANYKDCPKFNTHNDYYTPYSAWEQIKPYIQEKGFNKIFECFLLNSNEQSKKHLQKLGFEVIGNKNVNFLEEETWSEEMINKEYDCILSNPPYERVKSYKDRENNLKYKCIKKLFEIDKPFVVILNSCNMFQKWFKELVGDKDIYFIISSKKIQFDKYKEGGEELIKQPPSCSSSFNAIYVCYKVIDSNIWI
tara:strand:+ start:97 stop:675 length:579 start_codon:yes stop_codon:yes gene_type:complete